MDEIRHPPPLGGTLRRSPTVEGVVVTEAGSYLRLIDSCITQLKTPGPSSFCNESKEEEEGVVNDSRVNTGVPRS